MCGIFSVIISPGASVDADWVKSQVTKLYHLSEIRGRDATGIAVCSNNGIEIFKRACSASDFISTSEYAEVFNNRNIEKKLSSGIAIIGHTRLATNGNPFNPSNNQPIFFGDIVIAHNGITPREEKVWSSFDIEATNFSSDTLGLAVALQKTNDKSE